MQRDMNMDEARKWAGTLDEIYNAEGGDYKVKPIDDGEIGFYLFIDGSRMGDLLCSEDTISAFYEVENSDVLDKEGFYKLFKNEAMRYGLEARVPNPDAITWRDVKEFVDYLSDRELDTEFIAMIDGEATEFHAIDFNSDTNVLIVR